MTRLRVRPEADRDIDRAADYYAHEASIDLALRFLGAIDETLARLRRHPLSGSPLQTDSPRLAGLRVARVKDFESYLVFHVVAPECIEVVRVLHGARDLAALLLDEPDDVE